MKPLIILSFAALSVFALSCQQKPKEEATEVPAKPQEQQTQQTAQPTEQPKEVAQAPASADAEQLAKSKGCFACHDINTKKVGPAFKDVAKKEAGKLEEVAQRIKNGGVGSWGNVPMPPQNVTDEEAKKLAQWILSLK